MGELVEYHDEGPIEGEVENADGKVDAAQLNSPGSYSDGHGGVDMLHSLKGRNYICNP